MSMVSPGQLQHPGVGAVMLSQQLAKGEVDRHAGLDSSGADLGLVGSYLQQLLPALADGTNDGLGSLGLDRQSLLAIGMPQHSINSLYRSLAAHAGAFKKLMFGEVQQLRQLLQAPQLTNILQLLDGPIASTAQQTLKAGRTRSMQEALQAQVQQQQQLLTIAAADSIPSTDNKAESSLGPTADELMKNYADAYANMKETMEVRLRHEQRRGDFLAGKLQQTEGTLRDTMAQLDSASRRIADQRAEAAELQEQILHLQSDLAASHAAHLALQQHHTESMQAASQEKQTMEEQHKKIVETLQQDLTAAGGAAAALAESSRQVEALRLLYNEELSRASRLAVELSRATAAADKAAAAEDAWIRQLQKSESKADNAQGMASAMKVTVKQLEEELAQERAKLEEKSNHAAQLRLMLERSRLAAVEQHAHARAVVVGLAAKLETSETQLSELQTTLSRTEDNLKLRMMELDGANAQLQAGRSHLKQLLSDLETEQERTANLSSDLQKMRDEVEEAATQLVVAEGRVKNLQNQISKANESNAAMHEKLMELQSKFQVQTADLEQLQEAHEAEQAAHTALRTEATKMQARLVELSTMEQQLKQLKEEHVATEAKLQQAEEHNLALNAKARQLDFTASQLQELRQDHSALQARSDALSQQLTAVTNSLTASQTAKQASAAEVVQLMKKLEQLEHDRAQLMRKLFDATTAGDGAQQQATNLSQQLEMVQQSLETAEADRQALVAQRDAWMASFQEAYGKLQEWTVSSEAASRRLATRASAIQAAMQQLSTQQAEGHAAADRKSAVGLGLSLSGSEAASEAIALAGAEDLAAAAVTASVLDQMAGLQQLMQAETTKNQETFNNSLKALQQRVSERHQAAQASWAETMAASNSKHAARAAARASQKHGLSIMAAAGQHALITSAAGAELEGAAGGEMQFVMQQQRAGSAMDSRIAVLAADYEELVSAQVSNIENAPATALAPSAGMQHHQTQLGGISHGACQLLEQTAVQSAMQAGTVDYVLQQLAAIPERMPLHQRTVVPLASAVGAESLVCSANVDNAAAASSSKFMLQEVLPAAVQSEPANGVATSQKSITAAGMQRAGTVQSFAADSSCETVTKDHNASITDGAIDTAMAAAAAVPSNSTDMSGTLECSASAAPTAAASASAVNQAVMLNAAEVEPGGSAGTSGAQQMAASVNAEHHPVVTATAVDQMQQDNPTPAVRLSAGYAPAPRQMQQLQQQTHIHQQQCQHVLQQQQVLQHPVRATLQPSPQVMQQQHMQQVQQLVQRQQIQQKAYQQLLQQHHLLQQQHQMLLQLAQQQQQQSQQAGGEQAVATNRKQFVPSMQPTCVSAYTQQQQQQKQALPQPRQPTQTNSMQQQQHSQCLSSQQQPGPPTQTGNAAMQLAAAAQTPVTLHAHTAQQQAAYHLGDTEQPLAVQDVIVTGEHASTADLAGEKQVASAAATAATQQACDVGMVSPCSAGWNQEHGSAACINSEVAVASSAGAVNCAPPVTSVSNVGNETSPAIIAGGAAETLVRLVCSIADTAVSSAACGAVAPAGDSGATGTPVQAALRQMSTHSVVTSTTTTVTTVATSASSSGSDPDDTGGGMVSTRVEWSRSSSSRLQSGQALQHSNSSSVHTQHEDASAVDQQPACTVSQWSSSQPAPNALIVPSPAAASGSMLLDKFDASLSNRLIAEEFPNIASIGASATSALGDQPANTQSAAPSMLNAASDMVNTRSSQGDGFFLQSTPWDGSETAAVNIMQVLGAELGFNMPSVAQGPAGSMMHQSFAPTLSISSPATVLGIGSAASLDSPSSPAVGPSGGMLSGFVSLATYQEQMQSMATLHGQVGQLVVQLREAHADADGAQQQLQQERQEAVQRTTVLREALGQLHGQLEELRTDHEALQEAHRVLVAKDLMKSGVLKDRYVADLFARLQEAEWKLSIARQRACTWGFDMLVPLGRVDRGIQTQYAEVWAASQLQQGQTVSLQAKQLQIASKQQWLLEGPASPHRPLSGGGSRRHLLDPLPLGDPGAGMSSATSSAATVALLGSPKVATGSAAVGRKQPAFTQHGPARSSTGSKHNGSESNTRVRPLSAESATADFAATVGEAATAVADLAALSAAVVAAAEQLLAAGTIQTLSAAALLQLMASLYSAKAAADATALRSHRPAQGLWEFVLSQLQPHQSGKALPPVAGSTQKRSAGTRAAKGSGCGSDDSSSSTGAAAALAQLLGSLQQHAGSNKGIAQFAAALAASKAEYQRLLPEVQQSHSTASKHITRSSSISGNALNNSCSRDSVLVKGTWGEVRLDSGKLSPLITDPEHVLLPPCVVGLLQRMLGWPGMLPLLRWVADGHFLWCLREGDLGKILMDVQAPHVHFLLLEAADILGIHPLPQIHIVQAAAPFVYMLQVPTASLTPSSALAKAKGTKASGSNVNAVRQQQQQEVKVYSTQRQVLLVISSASLQLLQPAELQAALAAAMIPAVLASPHRTDAEELATGDSSSTDATSTRAATEPSGCRSDRLDKAPGHPQLADLATLASLLALQPSMLLSHLPPEMHAMGGSLAAALQAAQRIAAVLGDRGSLLVAQDLGVAINALVRTSAASTGGSDAGTSNAGAGCRDSLIQQWLQRAEDEQHGIPALQQLLPTHGLLASSADAAETISSTSGSRHANSGCEDTYEVDDYGLLLMRVRDLSAWAASDQYQNMMAAARPLRRVLPRNRAPSA